MNCSDDLSLMLLEKVKHFQILLAFINDDEDKIDAKRIGSRAMGLCKNEVSNFITGISFYDFSVQQ